LLAKWQKKFLLIASIQELRSESPENLVRNDYARDERKVATLKKRRLFTGGKNGKINETRRKRFARAYLHKIVHVILAHRQLRCCASLRTHFIYEITPPRRGAHARDSHHADDGGGRFGALWRSPLQHCGRGDARAAADEEPRMSSRKCVVVVRRR